MEQLTLIDLKNLVYDKIDNNSLRTTQLNFQHAVFVDRTKTGDYQTTYGLREILRQRIDLKALLNCIDSHILLSKAEIEFTSLVKKDQKMPQWKSCLDELLIDGFM